MENKIKVYIASPYTVGNTTSNVRENIKAGSLLMERGYIPFMPLLTHFADLLYPKSYEEWMQYDLAWLEMCDCVLRLPGESPGAERELKYARELGKPVFYSIKEIVKIYEH